MKKTIIGVFESRRDAEKAINEIHNKANVSTDDISYLYRNTDDEIKQVDADKIASDTAGEGAGKGAGTGAVIGAIAGIAAAAGVIPVIGPLVAAGSFIGWLGLGGAVGAAAAGAVGGAAIGGIVGALVNIGVGKERAQMYEDDVKAGKVLVSAMAENDADVVAAMEACDAISVETYTVQV